VNLTIADSVTYIGRSAFEFNNLAEITISEYVVDIDSYAFRNNPITQITIEGVETRFNDEWTSIGFPVELMPTP
jgi:hypothetical protein